jgi:Tol biopolymer transport system component/DNA-binding winged helix-turn-helix (wHTH) protein
MSAETGSPEIIQFGPFKANLRTKELTKNGTRLRLPGQSFHVLRILLERQGDLVTREELQQALWPAETFVDFDHGLNATVNRLREVLGDSAESPKLIETLPRRGYRFIGTIVETQLRDTHPSDTQSAQAQAALSVDELEDKPAAKPVISLRGVAALAAICAALAGSLWLRSIPSPPRVVGYKQLTRDRQLKNANPCGAPYELATDGSRVFFSEPSSSVKQVSAGGGDAISVSVPFPCFRIFDISPDKTELLGEAQDGNEFDQPLWILSTSGGLARRLGGLSGHSGAWSPDGRRIAYATGNSAVGPDTLYSAAKDGTDVRKLLEIKSGHADPIRWSPDGKVLRLFVVDKFSTTSLYEVGVNGNNLHAVKLFSNSNRSLLEGNWTSDGNYFLFSVLRDDMTGSDLFALRESHSLFGGRGAKPVQLTTEALSLWSPTPNPNGKQLFAIGGRIRGEVVRYDLKTKRLEPFLSGISGEQLDFSKDGNWVAYVSFPESVLWRSRLDGSERVQLTDRPLTVALPRWSPDGKRIAFSGLLPGETWKAYIVALQGGKPEIVSQTENDQMDPTWSPDGNSLIIGGRFESGTTRISTIDVRTGSVTPISGSDGLFSPRTSPDGRYIVALNSPEETKLTLFDKQTQEWSELMYLANATLSWPSWSSDSKSVVVADNSDLRHLVFYQISITDHKVRRLAAIELPEGLIGNFSGWSEVSPDGSLLLLRDLSIQEIYALDVELP